MSPRLSLALCALVFAASCNCKGPIVVPGKDKDCLGVAGVQVGHDSSCDPAASDCADHFTCGAVGATHCCVFADRKCLTEADCCPGQTCPTDRKKCFDKFRMCTVDADCGEAGVCTTYSDIYSSSSRCRFKACGALGACPDGQSCFQGECIVGLPCGGACEAGKGCVTDTDRCQDFAKLPATPLLLDGGTRKANACPMTCNVGFLATFKDPTNIFDSCNLVGPIGPGPSPGCQVGIAPSATAVRSAPAQK